MKNIKKNKNLQTLLAIKLSVVPVAAGSLRPQTNFKDGLTNAE